MATYSQSEYDRLQQQIAGLQSRRQSTPTRSTPYDAGLTFSSRTSDPYRMYGGKESYDLQNQIADLERQAAAVNPNSPTAKAEQAWQAGMDLTKGQSDKLMNDPRITAALDQLQAGMASGPYSDAVQQQLISRRADQSARAEQVNANDIRNEAAAKGLDPTQALRQAQQERQQSNLAFSGDIRTNAVLQNYAAQQQAAQALAAARMSQYGQAQTGYSQAANANLNRQFGGGRTSAVQGGSPVFTGGNTSGGGTAFQPSVQPVRTGGTSAQPTATGQSKPMSVADRNAAQAAWVASGGRPAGTGSATNLRTGQTITTTPAAPQQAQGAFGTPATYSGTAFGPTSTSQAVRSYQNIYKYL